MLEIATTRPPVRLFPNLRSLGANMNLPEFNSIIMNESVEDLCVVVPKNPAELDHHVQHIVERMPNITSLELRTPEIQSVSVSEDVLKRFFRGLNHLTKVTLPLYWLTSSLASCLSTIQGIREISINTKMAWDRHGLSTDVAHFFPKLDEDAFSSLEHLSFATSLDIATFLIQWPPFPASTVKSLWLRVTHIHEGNAIELQSFLKTLETYCNSLERLEIILTPLKDDNEHADSKDTGDIDFSYLLPIFSLRNMRTFIFRHASYLCLTNDQAEFIAKQWPRIEELVLSPHPTFHDYPTTELTPHALISFAAHCPHLRSLGLVMSTRDDDVLEPLPSFDTPFKELAILDVGYTEPMENGREKLCRFLSRLLPADCAIKTRAVDDDEPPHTDGLLLEQPSDWGWRGGSDEEDALEFWTGVARTLSLMNETREQGRREGRARA